MGKQTKKNRMLNLIKEIFPFQRMINSKGLNNSFNIIEKYLPGLKIHEYEVGSESESWIVPLGWSVINGYMKDKENKEIASTKESVLFVAPYSKPVEGWFSKNEIRSHLSTRKDRPDDFVLEHRNAYNYKLQDWGITLPYNRWNKLTDDLYYINIETEEYENTMKVGEYYIRGNSDETIFICAHIDELCNDDLSGCAVAVELINHIKSLSNLIYSYRLLLVPETIGTIFYFFNNLSTLNKTTGMIFLETLGAGENLCLKKSLSSDSFNEILRYAIRKSNSKFVELDFYQGYSNDEKIFEWPTFRFPGVSLLRFPFKEYHTSSDTPEIIKIDYLEQSLEICKNFIDTLEKNYIPIFSKKLPPYLSRFDLYYESNEFPEVFLKYNNILLYNINGNNSVMDLSRITDLQFEDLYNHLEKFYSLGFINKFKVKY